MSEVCELSDLEKSFLEPYLPPVSSAKGVIFPPDQISPPLNKDSLRGATSAKDSLPFVTLTYASSLDSMISLAPGLRTTLSGPETKSMTHYLRLRHDAILIGVGTAIPDDPGLNSRYPGSTLERQPRPVVIDPELRWDVRASKVAQLARLQQGKMPWLVHTPHAGERVPLHEFCRYIVVTDECTQPDSIQGPTDRKHFNWLTILQKLKAEGIESVMIEGGATVISNLLSLPDLVNSVIVTIAPTWLGQGGVTVSPTARTEAGGRVNAASLQATAWRQFGADVVLCGRLQR